MALGKAVIKRSPLVAHIAGAAVSGGATPEGTAVLSTGEAGGTKYLREDGDGTCSWQAVSAHTPEGTAVLSTGEAGGTKFLREDGDGTCSWQAPSVAWSGLTGSPGDSSSIDSWWNTTFALGTAALAASRFGLGTSDSVTFSSVAAGTFSQTGEGGMTLTQTATSSTGINLIDGDVTWNDGFTTFSLLDFAVTDTSSIAKSSLLKFTVDGSVVFDLRKDGIISTGGTSTDPAFKKASGKFQIVDGDSETTLQGLELGTIDLGHATDTTLSRVSAGVVAIEGSNILVSGGALGTPSGGTLTNATGLPISTGVSGLGSNVATALGIAVGFTGAPVVLGGVLGTPASGTLSNCTVASATAKGVVELATQAEVDAGTDPARVVTPETLKGWDGTGKQEVIGIACSDETTALTASTSVAKVTFTMPFAMTLTEVMASVVTAPTGSALVVDIHDGATTIMSTNKLDILASAFVDDNTATLSDTALAKDAIITVYADSVGATIAGAGLKIWLIGTRT